MEFQESQVTPKDGVSNVLKLVSQNILIFVFGVLPLFFLPITFAPFDHTKILFVIVGLMLALVFFSLSVLRSGVLTISAPQSVFLVWLIPLSAVVSALISGDVYDSLIGDSFATQSALFLVLLAAVATGVTLILNQKAAILRFYVLLLTVSILLGLFHLSRVLLGADFLTFGVFQGAVTTPLGNWNDLGLFFGLAVILSLVALEQLPITKIGKIIVGGIIFLSLLILAVVNFFAVWVVLGAVSLVMLIYSISKDRFGGSTFTQNEKTSSIGSIVVSLVVFATSFVFIVGGTAVGGVVSNITHISFIEVRPSFSATVDIAKSVYSENAFVGIGPNKFIDAWRLHKDSSINQTVFWNTDFTAGNGYITTLFATTGILGIVAWLVFFIFYIRAGIRMLFKSQNGDRLFFFIGSSSFIASIYLWGMALLYVPSATILMLVALFTGITYTVYSGLLPNTAKTITFKNDKRTGFVLVTIIMVLIIGSVTTMYTAGRHYAAAYVFAKSISSISDGTSLESVEQSISDAYSLSSSDVFARQVASYQIARMNTLLALSEPTPEQQQQFQTAVANGVNSARLAVDADGSDATNWATLGAVYSAISLAGIEGAYDRSKEAFLQARALDPNNPAYILAEAQLESRNGNLESAKAFAEEAIRLRPQYVEAVNFLSQIEVAAGNVSGAIESTIAATRLEPNNPSRYYQLGVLYSSNSDVANATVAFERAVTLDPNFANARYFLALAYLEQNRSTDAVEQLKVVAALNPDNTDVPTLISRIESGEVVGKSIPSEQIVEPSSVIQEGDSVSSVTVPDTPLVSPVNPGVGSPDTANEEQTESVPTV